jgi:hypothetical protein
LVARRRAVHAARVLRVRLPAPATFGSASLQPPAARWNTDLGEYLLDWDDVITMPDPHLAAREFGRSAVARAFSSGGWDPTLAASAQGTPPPVI